jgi:TRAP-type C4-dicarboxylate transport system substrate-binding protein
MRRCPFVVASALVAAMLVAAGCTSGAGDKAGGSSSVVLRLSIGYGGLDYLPAAAYFVKRVGELSGGALRIEVVHNRGVKGEPEFEQDIVRDVEAGKVDLAVVGTRVFDTFGVKSFQALTAPMLVDSYPLLQTVLDSEVPAQMLKSLDGLGVMGLGIIGDSLRRPSAVDRPLLGPADWRGTTFAVISSEGQTEAIRALGAKPTGVWGNPMLSQGLASGQIQGVEKGLLAYEVDTLDRFAPYVTANVTLWPQTIAIVSNPSRLSGLTKEQRDWLDLALRDAAARSTRLVKEGEGAIVTDLCHGATRFAEASQADLAALGQSFAPVYADFERDAQTKTFIDRIEQLKASTPPGPALSIPAGCTGLAPRGNVNDALTGSWKTGTITEAQWVHAFVAGGGKEQEAHLAWGSQLNASWSFQFEKGYFTLISWDGTVGYGPDPYEIDADGTLTIRDRLCVATYTFTITGDILRLTVVRQCPGDDAPYNTAFFASFPFTRSS